AAGHPARRDRRIHTRRATARQCTGRRRLRIHWGLVEGKATVIFFRRRNKRQEPAPEGAEPHDAPPTAEEDRASKGTGPWDLADQPELGKGVDVGALRVTARPGVQRRRELEPK